MDKLFLIKLFLWFIVLYHTLLFFQAINKSFVALDHLFVVAIGSIIIEVAKDLREEDLFRIKKRTIKINTYEVIKK